MKTNGIIKSKERVRNLAEVFTSEREVRSMLDLVRYLSENVQNTFLEPACGNGNFLVEILKRKLDTVKSKYRKQLDVEFYILLAVSSIYGIDISEENVIEARERMLYTIKEFYSNTYNTRKPTDHFWDSVRWVLEHNIILGDMLNKIDKISLIEYSTPKKYFFKRQEFRLADQLKNKKSVVSLFESQSIPKSYEICNYQQLCS
ncbi:MAG: SAM-dependent DNA methyltransferase [bacterium]|nr:SAM-dependent DNA methyltransferase [bacterium]